MQGIDDIAGSSGIDIGALGARFGLSPEQTRTAIGSLMPAIAGGFQKKAETGNLGHLAAASGIDHPDTDAGNNILGQIFGSKDVSRQVACQAAEESGISSTAIKALLPIAAAMIAKHMAGSMGGGAGPGGAGLGGVLGQVLAGGGGIGGLGGMLGGGGNPLDDILAGAAGPR
jgi:hypothetical protein